MSSSPLPLPLSPNQQRAAAVRLLCLDVDGTLTDGTLVSSPHGYIRPYHVLDGFGVSAFVRDGGIAAIISAAQEGHEEIRARAAQMRISHIYFDFDSKLSVVKKIMQAENLTAEAVAYIGDDLPDAEAMRYVGFACAPRTAHPTVLALAHYVPCAPAGFGAVREVCDFIMRHRKQPPGRA